MSELPVIGTLCHAQSKDYGDRCVAKEICGEGFFFDVRKTRQINDFFSAVLSEMVFFCTTLLLLCFLIVGIHSSGISIPLSLFTYMNCLFDIARVVIRVTINKFYFVPEWFVSSFVSML